MSKSADMNEWAMRIRAARLPPPPVCRAIRQGAGVSLREVGQLIGVSPMTVLRWERGDVRPKRDHAIAYRELLDVLSGVGR